MAELLSVDAYPADGIQNQFEVSFAGGYIDRSHVIVRVYDADLVLYTEPAVTFVGDYQVSLSPTPASGKIVKIYRNTPADKPIVDFSDGSVINEEALDTNAKQAVFLVAELRDTFGTVADIDGIGAALAEFDSALDDINSRVQAIATRAAMKALGDDVPMVYLSEAGREGTFLLKTGSAPSDTNEGLYIVSDTPSRYWQRVWDGVNGQVEWFGAVANSVGAAAANTVAIQACIDKCSVTHLGGGDYFTNNTLTITTNGTAIKGVAHTQTDQALTDASPRRTTQIVCTSASATILRVGSASATDPGMLVETVKLNDFTVNRNVNPFTPVSGIIGSIGIDCRWMVNSHAERVFSINSAIGWRFFGTVENYITRCGALRDKEGSNAANDVFIGFYGDWAAPGPYNGGNASLYFTQCRVFALTGNATPALTYSAGWRLDGGYVDLYLEGCETGFPTMYGLHGIGTGSATIDVKTEDLIIKGCVFDAATVAAIKIEDSGPQTQITIANSYFATTSATAIILLNVGGNVVISTNEFMNGFAPNAGTSIGATNCTGVYCESNVHQNIKSPHNFNNVAFFTITDKIHSVDATATNTFPAILLAGSTGCKSGYISPVIFGPGACYAAGVLFADANEAKIEINVTTMELGAVANKKINNNGSTISAAGAFGTNCLASGIFA